VGEDAAVTSGRARSGFRNAGRASADVLAERPALDYLAAGLLVGLHLMLIRKTGSGDVLMWGDREVRKDVYMTFVAFITFVGGFGVLALSTYTAARGPRVGMLRSHAGRELRRTLLAGLTGPVVTAVVIIAVMSADVRDADKVGLRFVGEAAIFFGLVRLLRLGYVMRALITAHDQDQAAPEFTASPAPAPAFPVLPGSPAPPRQEYGAPATRRRPPARREAQRASQAT
jgi:hypothetical protein